MTPANLIRENWWSMSDKTKGLRCERVVSEVRAMALSRRSLDAYAHVEDGWMEMDPVWAAKSAAALASNNQALMLSIHLGDEIIGWGAAIICTPSMHSRTQVLKQAYLHTFVDGRWALRSVVLFHEEMEKFAISKGVGILMSDSYLGSQETFYRILSGIGWTRRGAAMYRRVGPLRPPRVGVYRSVRSRPFGAPGDGVPVPVASTNAA